MSAAAAPVPLLGVVSDRRRLCGALGIGAAEAFAALEAQAAAAAASGVTFFQLREPDLDAADLLTLTRRLRARAAGRMTILMNDRADVAVAAGVGVHLKRSSLPATRLRAWLPDGTFVSRSVHGADEARGAGPVDALLAGTLAPTPSKAGAPLLGLDGLARVVAASAAPVYAIGGVRPAAWPAIAATGAVGCAAIGAFLPRAGQTIEAALREAVEAFSAAV